jgi:hypothetical protein
LQPAARTPILGEASVPSPDMPAGMHLSAQRDHPYRYARLLPQIFHTDDAHPTHRRFSRVRNGAMRCTIVITAYDPWRARLVAESAR